MPAFRNELPAQDKHMGFDLRRTPATASLTAVVTCDDFYVVDTHYYHGRTTPCERFTTDEYGKTIAGNCAACAETMPYRSHVYISAFDNRTHEHFLFECTAHAAKPFAEYAKAVGTLRGCAFQATRPKGAKNSKVVITTATANLGKINLPDPPDIVKALCVIWRIPTPTHACTTKAFISATMEPDETVSAPGVRPSRGRLTAQRTQPDNQEDEETFLARRKAFDEALQTAANPNGKPKKEHARA
jgi:hypothetical protein